MFKLNFKFDVSLSNKQRDKVRNGITDGLVSAISYLTLLVQNKSKEAITQGPTRAIDTGHLRGSIRGRSSGLKGIIEPNTDYSGFVHWGTRFMRKRPYMEKGVELSFNSATQDVVTNIVNKKID